MIRTALKLIIKVLESKLVKSGLEETILRNKNYVTVGKAIWNIVDENFRISKTVEEKVLSKADKFDELLLAKFPELTKEDVAEIRQSIAGEINQGKAAILDNSALINKLQADNATLKEELRLLTDQLSKVKSLVAVTTNTDAQQATA